MLKQNTMAMVLGVWSAAMIGGGCNCQTKLALAGTTTVAIDAPTDGSTFLDTDTITLTAHADNPVGLISLAIDVGLQQLLMCNGNGTGDGGTGSTETHLDCSSTFTANDPNYASQVGGGHLVLSAIAIDNNGITATATVTVNIGTPAPPDAGPPVWFVNIIQPMPDNGIPPEAVVSGSGPLQIAIVGTPGGNITDIKVVTAASNGVQTSIADYTATPYASTIDWQTTPGPGTYTLTATATDSTGTQKSNSVVLLVNSTGCTSDSACVTGSRCCLDDGQCHPIVAENAACDCSHPCPTDEGCFPGTCGKLPQQCRPGCNPGNENRKADTCAPINGVQAYCEPLPASQVTAQNKGGACAPGDGCDVAMQNCPDGPLYPDQDAGPPSNPIVHYTCEPAAMNGNSEATVCFPAGTWPPQGVNTGDHCLGENDSCGSDTAGCVQGYECVGIEGQPNAGLGCAQQCSSPQSLGFSCPRSGAGGCPSGQFCDQLIGNGGVTFTTGVCVALSEIGC